MFIIIEDIFLFCFQSESQDQVFLRWTTGETATMHILVVHAMVILLTLGPPKGTVLLRMDVKHIFGLQWDGTYL